MYSRFCLAIALFVAVPMCAQVNDNSTTTNDSTGGDDARMLTPPPVSGASYPTAPESESRSNYLRAGVVFNTAYSDNVLGGVTGKPVSDVDYSVWPTISLDETTTRLRSVLTYAPGFTFYQRTDGRNEADQNASIDVQYRLSQHVTVSVRDVFQKTSNVFNQPDLLSATPVFGSAQVPTTAVVPPIADRLSNNANADLTYQFSRRGMIGGGETFTNLHYPDSSEVPGLFDSSSRGGSAFYSHRLSKKHYVGAQYQYSRILEFPTGPQFETQTHTVFLFYTVYFKPTLSLSFSGGPQRYEAQQGSLFDSHAWSPAATASLGWQGRHTTFAAGYSRTVTGGGGLAGAFESNNANASARWQMARSWSIGTAGTYAIYKNVISSVPAALAASSQGGHSISGSVSLEHSIGQHFGAELGYTRLHQSYSGIVVVATAPDINREYISISYRFNRPLGR
jgi:hypothetical protein